MKPPLEARPGNRRATLRFVVVTTLAASAQAAVLNDTGQTQCYDAADASVVCSSSVGGDNGTNPRQDARYGRDAAATAGQLRKMGAGVAAFDYTKIANDGSILPSDASPGSGATEWACTRDNVTGLIWEVKTTSGLRDRSHTYTWYSTDLATNGANAGAVGRNTCASTLAVAPHDNQCNTRNFVAAVNASPGLCGASDWRLPTRRELLTLTDSGASPAIDANYFPNTITSEFHWTSNTYTPDAALVWVVGFFVGDSLSYHKDYLGVARLVRGGL